MKLNSNNEFMLKETPLDISKKLLLYKLLPKPSQLQIT